MSQYASSKVSRFCRQTVSNPPLGDVHSILFSTVTPLKLLNSGGSGSRYGISGGSISGGSGSSVRVSGICRQRASGAFFLKSTPEECLEQCFLTSIRLNLTFRLVMPKKVDSIVRRRDRKQCWFSKGNRDLSSKMSTKKSRCARFSTKPAVGIVTIVLCC